MWKGETMSGYIRRLTGVTLLIFAPTAAWAQALAGVVKDTTGAVLPGVTVEASSPALIEKVRTTVSDASGQYQIVDIRPGTYSVSFTLSGFTTVRRERIDVTGTATSTVNAELRPGDVRETVTVTGEAPVVDTHNVSQQQVIDKAILEAMPLGRSYFNVAVIVPGMKADSNHINDVGGTGNLTVTNGFTIHGSRGADMRVTVAGQQTRDLAGNGQGTNYIPDFGSMQETTIDYVAGSGEMATGGIRINLIPREGGNTFSGSVYGTGVGPPFQADNFSQALKDQGLTGVNRLKLQYDVNPAGGGPILRDKLWFFVSARWQTNQNYLAGLYENLNAFNPASWQYAPNLSKQAADDIDQANSNIRVTWQASPRNKFSFFFDRQWRNWNFDTPTVSPESSDQYHFTRNWLGSATWTAPLTNRLLLEAHFSDHPEVFVETHPDNELTPVVEQSTGLLYRGPCLQGPFFNPTNIPCGQAVSPNTYDIGASLSYVTGAHNLKFGFTELRGRLDFYSQSVGAADISYRFNNGVPNQITEYATPWTQSNDLNDLSLYAQDSWTVKRLTINAGLRFDYFATSFPAYQLGPNQNLPNRNLTFPATDGYDFKDLGPRLGAVYDLFGDSKTAVKVSLGRYVIGVNGEFGSPVVNQANQVSRSWTPTLPPGDPNYYVPQCNLLNPMANGDCGTISDLTFGGTKPSTVNDPATLRGWGNRPDDWEFSTSVQHQLAPRVSVDVGYFRRWFGNFVVTDNTAVQPTDFSPFDVTAPVDPRLPGGGGNVVSGLYNLNPNKVGQVANVRALASNYGSQIEHWNGLDFTVNVRPRGGMLLQGGVSTGRTTTDDCSIVQTYLGEVSVTTMIGDASQSVQSTQMCHLQTPFLTQVKLMGTYPIPKVGVNASAFFQSLPGPLIAANYTASNAQVQPSLGRPLSGGASNVTVNIVQPGTLFGERLNQLDLRFEKLLTFGRTRPSLQFDLYNVTNANPVLTLNSSYGAWQTPLSILNARLFRLGVRFDF
jgi:hypothetical protein